MCEVVENGPEEREIGDGAENTEFGDHFEIAPIELCARLRGLGDGIEICCGCAETGAEQWVFLDGAFDVGEECKTNGAAWVCVGRAHAGHANAEKFKAE